MDAPTTEPPVLTGPAQVRERLIHLIEGLPRPKKTGAEAWARDLDMLAKKLGHMSAQALDGLAELTLRTAAGKACPGAGLILSWGYAMEPPPVRSSDYAQSIVASAMGRAALDGGYVVELLRHARAHRPPPQSYLLFKIREEADANRRRRDAIRIVQEAGRASPEELRWLDAWHADHALCLALQHKHPEGDGE